MGLLGLTLGARDFSSAVSGFCQVFIDPREKLRHLWLRPTAEDVSAFGQPRKFPPHAKKTSGTQGASGFVMKECLRGRLAIACVALQAFDREREGNLGGRPRARSPEKGFAGFA